MTDMPKQACTACGKQLDAVSHVKGDAIPDEGDISLCLYCGHIMVFGQDLILREPTTAECSEIAGRKDILAVQKARWAVMK